MLVLLQFFLQSAGAMFALHKSVHNKLNETCVEQLV